MNDLVDRLRFVFSVSSGAPTLLTEAADEIERLRKDAERWRHASTSRNFGITFWSEHGQATCFDSLAAQKIDAALQAKEQG